VDTIERQWPGEAAREAANRVSSERGVAIGDDVRRAEALGRPCPERTFAAALAVLEHHRLEPYREGDPRVRNCPFHPLAQRAPDLVCEMNRSFVDGILRGLGNSTVEAAIERRPGGVLRRAPALGGRQSMDRALRHRCRSYAQTTRRRSRPCRAERPLRPLAAARNLRSGGSRRLR
jgi:predicted ArsR family transcriptional regulator